MAQFDGDQVRFGGILDQRTDPIGLRDGIDGRSQAGDYFGEALAGQDSRMDRLPAGRLFIEDTEVGLAILRQRAGTPHRGGRHLPIVDSIALGKQLLSLTDAKTMLFVDNGQLQGLEIDPFLKNRMGAEDD